MHRLGRTAVFLLVVALAAPAVPVNAHDHKRPKVMLRSHGERQRGMPWTSEWTRADGKFCVSGVGDGIPNYRRTAMTWNPDNPLHLYFYKRQEPDTVKSPDASSTGLRRFP